MGVHVLAVGGVSADNHRQAEDCSMKALMRIFGHGRITHHQSGGQMHCIRPILTSFTPEHIPHYHLDSHRRSRSR